MGHQQPKTVPPRWVRWLFESSRHRDEMVLTLGAKPDMADNRLREAFGNTMSDEFVAVLLGKLVETLRPGPFDELEEPTLNAALAIINSMQPQSARQRPRAEARDFKLRDAPRS